jgi:Cu(I)/Ag(I) efflux system membrane fusion protein
MTNYFKLKEACVNNDQSSAKSISTVMKNKINKIDISVLSNKDFYAWSKQQTSLDYILSEIANGSDIKNSRLNFQDLHSPLYKILTTFGISSGPIYVQYCPMAFENSGANWLSDNEDITNPYFGDKMLECGTNTEVISFE